MQPLRILIVGGGGREHALAWSLAREPHVQQVYVAPGNAGTAWAADEDRAPATCVPIGVDEVPALIEFAQQQHIDLTVIGPEAPLVGGLVDTMQAHGLRVFGPTMTASQLEGSKAFAKAIMHECGIPTAPYARFDDYAAATAYVAHLHATQPAVPLVIKADGLASGKGVLICDDAATAHAALHRLMVTHDFGNAGDTVIIEERLTGPELSVLAFSDGKTVVALPPARDHKRALDGDHGPNTGGMGAYCPVPDLTPAMLADIEQRVLQPVIQAMAARGTPYVGVLYAGLMLTASGPQVLEFNCRFGDPEAQAILPLLDNLLELLQACVDGTLATVTPRLQAGACATVVMASPGYPGSYPRGLPITGWEDVPPDVQVFQAGTARNDAGQLVTSGGRVLAVSGRGDTLDAALARAYAGVTALHFEGAHYRRDIGRTTPTGEPV